MSPIEQSAFFQVVTEGLALYAREPSEKELLAWWSACKQFAMADVRRALASHSDDADEGKRAPRPIDIVRKIESGSSSGGSQCAASDFTGRCQYPGIFSDGTSGEGPWFCPWHREERNGPDASRWIETSRKVPWEVARQKRIDRMNAEGTRTPGVVNTAHAIALRHGDRPWQAALEQIAANAKEAA